MRETHKDILNNTETIEKQNLPLFRNTHHHEKLTSKPISRTDTDGVNGPVRPVAAS